MTVFSSDESTNKVVVYVGILQKGDRGKLDVSEWLSNVLVASRRELW